MTERERPRTIVVSIIGRPVNDWLRDHLPGWHDRERGVYLLNDDGSRATFGVLTRLDSGREAAEVALAAADEATGGLVTSCSSVTVTADR